MGREPRGFKNKIVIPARENPNRATRPENPKRAARKNTTASARHEKEAVHKSLHDVPSKKKRKIVVAEEEQSNENEGEEDESEEAIDGRGEQGGAVDGRGEQGGREEQGETVDGRGEQGESEDESDEEDDVGEQLDSNFYTKDVNHISHQIWEKPDYERLLLTHYYRCHTFRTWKLSEESEEVRKLVLEAGFGKVAEYCGRMEVDRVLITTIAERFYEESSSFHLPIGELTVTLDDVQNITGLPISGNMMKGRFLERLTEKDAASLFYNCLGFTKKEALIKAKSLSLYEVPLTWLRDEYMGQSAVMTPEVVARAYLLFLIGSVLMPSSSNANVHISYLQFLEKLENVKKFSWSTAVAHLYHFLHQVSQKSKSFPFCAPLLQTWIYDHFPTISSERANARPAYDSSTCRIQKWSMCERTEDAGPALYSLRKKLDDLCPREVIWDPYSNERETAFPIHPMNFYNGNLCCQKFVKPYYPDRVLRQFGFIQVIPRTPMGVVVDRKGEVAYNWDSWSSVQLEAMNRVSATTPWECTRDYMEWYAKVSHPFILDPKKRTDCRRSLYEKYVSIHL